MLTKQAARRMLLQDAAGGGYVIVTTADGAANGTTFVSSLMVGRGSDFLQGWWATRNIGDDDSEYRQVWQMDKATGVFSCLDTEGNGAGFATQVVEGETIELSPWRPDMFTTALNQAIEITRPWLNVPFWDGSITLTNGTYEYALPGGITQDMIAKVAMEGYGSFVGMPYYEWGDVSYRPSIDPTDPEEVEHIILNRTRPTYRDVVTGQKLYLIGAKYLTRFDLDTPTFTLVNDTVETCEISLQTQAGRLFMLFGRWQLMDLVAYQPNTQANVDWVAQTKQAEAAAYDKVSKWKMRPPESYSSFG